MSDDDGIPGGEHDDALPGVGSPNSSSVPFPGPLRADFPRLCAEQSHCRRCRAEISGWPCRRGWGSPRLTLFEVYSCCMSGEKHRAALATLPLSPPTVVNAGNVLELGGAVRVLL